MADDTLQLYTVDTVPVRTERVAECEHSGDAFDDGRKSGPHRFLQYDHGYGHDASVGDILSLSLEGTSSIETNTQGY